jgi:hypothetical protein
MVLMTNIRFGCLATSADLAWMDYMASKLLARWLRNPSITINENYGAIATLGKNRQSPILDSKELEYCSAFVGMKPAVPTKEKARKDSVVGGLEEGTEDVCFALMVVNSQMERIFNRVFAPVAKEFGLKAEHADMLPSSTVVPEIIRKIHTAKVILADITRHRPNVYYEIGFAHKVNRHKVIIIGQESYDELPSDIRQQSFRYIRYEDNTSGLSYLKTQLRKRFQNCLNQRRK